MTDPGPVEPGPGAAEGTARIRVVVNGKPREIAPERSVHELLRSLGLEPALVVVERNREILARDRYDDQTVEEGDVLELVHFVGGG